MVDRIALAIFLLGLTAFVLLDICIVVLEKLTRSSTTTVDKTER